MSTTTYKFSELSEAVQHIAHEKYAYDDVDLSLTVLELTELLEMIGFLSVKIYYSGFYSQGDGACFTGQYTYRKGFLKAVKSEWGNTELHAILDQLQALQCRNFYRLESDIYQRGHYVHENTMYYVHEHTMHDNHDNDLIYVWRSLAQWMYRHLKKEYAYQTSFEAFREMAEVNRWKFADEGENNGMKPRNIVIKKSYNKDLDITGFRMLMRMSGLSL